MFKRRRGSHVEGMQGSKASGSVFAMSLGCVLAKGSSYVIAGIMSLNEMGKEKNFERAEG